MISHMHKVTASGLNYLRKNEDNSNVTFRNNIMGYSLKNEAIKNHLYIRDKIPIQKIKKNPLFNKIKTSNKYRITSNITHIKTNINGVEYNNRINFRNNINIKKESNKLFNVNKIYKIRKRNDIKSKNENKRIIMKSNLNPTGNVTTDNVGPGFILYDRNVPFKPYISQYDIIRNISV